MSSQQTMDDLPAAQPNHEELVPNSTDEPSRLSMDEPVAPVIQQTVREMLTEGHEYSAKMDEAQPMSDHVLERFEAIAIESSKASPPPPTAPVARYNELLTQYIEFLKRFADEKAVFRLVHNRVVVREILQFHDDIDILLNGFKFPAGNGVLEQWRPRWKALRDAQYAVLQTTSRDRMLLLRKVDRQDTHWQTQALGLLLYEYNRVNSGYTKEELQLLLNAFNIVTKFSKNKTPTNETWLLPPYEVKINTAFAWGAYGKVHYGKLAGSDVAVKVMTIPEKITRAAFVAAFVKEANIWFSASKIPNVVRLFGAYYDAEEPYFVSEYASNGTLRSYLRREGNINQTWKLLHQVANGILGLHKHGILHNDLKCDNILVGADRVAKITDFGLCCQVSSLASDSAEEARLRLSEQADVGAIPWKAPEILAKTSDPSFESDIYSLAMCILEAVTRELPWGRKDPSMTRRQVIKGKMPPRPEHGFDDDQWDLVKQMCALNPRERPPMDEVVALLYEFEVREGNKTQRLQRRNSMLPALTAVAEDMGKEEEIELECGSDESSQHSASPRVSPIVPELSAPETTTASAGSTVDQAVNLIEPTIEVNVVSAVESAPPTNAEFPQPPTSIPVVVSESYAQPRVVVHANSGNHRTRAGADSNLSGFEPEAETEPKLEPGFVDFATVNGSRYVTLEGAKKQIVQYQVVIHLANGTTISVWKRFSAFRNFRRRLCQQNHIHSANWSRFPSRFAGSGNMSVSTVDHRTKSLRAFLNSVAASKDVVPFGVLMSENEAYSNQLIQDGGSVVLL